MAALPLALGLFLVVAFVTGFVGVAFLRIGLLGAVDLAALLGVRLSVADSPRSADSAFFAEARFGLREYE